MEALMMMLQTLASCTRCSRRKQAVPIPIARSELLAYRALGLQSPKAAVQNFWDDAGDVSTEPGELSELTDTQNGSDEEMMPPPPPPPACLAPPPGLAPDAEIARHSQATRPCQTLLYSTTSDLLPHAAEFFSSYEAMQGPSRPYSAMAPNGQMRVQPSQRNERPFTPFHSSAVRPAPSGRNPQRIPYEQNKALKTEPPTLKDNLFQLSNEDQDCIVMVKRISKLGLDAAKLLEVFFSRYGPIKQVLVSPCYDKKLTGGFRSRPASFGFVLFTTKAATEAAYAAGEEQEVVSGVTISIGPFEKKDPVQSVAPTVPANEGPTLKDNLFLLSHIDKKRVIQVRKISKLGIESPSLLEVHFSRYGPIERVLVAPCYDKTPGGVKNRPSSFGFVVFATPDGAAAAHAAGAEQKVLGVAISLGHFESRPPIELRDN